MSRTSFICALFAGGAFLLGYFIGQVVLLVGLRRRIEEALRRTAGREDLDSESGHEPR